MNSSGKSVIALATGLVIGAGLGLLFAPVKGKRLRKKIKNEVSRCYDQASSEFDKVRELFDEKKDKADQRKEGMSEV